MTENDVVALELDDVHAAVGAGDLVLAADALLELVLLEVHGAHASACASRVLPRMAVSTLMRPTAKAELEPMPERAGRSPW